MTWNSDSIRLVSTTWPVPECRATITANADTSAVISSVKAIGGRSGPPSGSPLSAAKPLIASAREAKPGRRAYGPSWPKPLMRAITSFGLAAISSSGRSPSSSSLPGRRFSTRTSAVATRRRMASRPASVLRSSTMERLPRPRSFHQNATPSSGSIQPIRLVPSPPGASTLTTSAPKSARYRAQPGPAMTVDMSTTRRSASGIGRPSPASVPCAASASSLTGAAASSAARSPGQAGADGPARPARRPPPAPATETPQRRRDCRRRVRWRRPWPQHLDRSHDGGHLLERRRRADRR